MPCLDSLESFNIPAFLSLHIKIVIKCCFKYQSRPFIERHFLGNVGWPSKPWSKQRQIIHFQLRAPFPFLTQIWCDYINLLLNNVYGFNLLWLTIQLVDCILFLVLLLCIIHCFRSLDVKYTEVIRFHVTTILNGDCRFQKFTGSDGQLYKAPRVSLWRFSA